MSQTEYELPSKFTRGDNYKGKNIISFSSAGRYFMLGSDKTTPIVISGPIQELLDKLVTEGNEKDYSLEDNNYLQLLPSSFPVICRLIQIQFPDVFIHLVTNKYANGTSKTKIVISGRVRYNHTMDNQIICYYPANRSIIVKKKASDEEFKELTGYDKSEFPYGSIPIISRHYRPDNMKKYSNDQIQKVLEMETEVLKNGTKYEPDILPAYQTICQWLHRSIAKVSPLKTHLNNTPVDNKPVGKHITGKKQT
jgi:hypothetical protein